MVRQSEFSRDSGLDLFDPVTRELLRIADSGYPSIAQLVGLMIEADAHSLAQ